MKIKYIAKPDEWFDEGTEAVLLEGPWDGEYPQSALFSGTKNGKKDEEVCLLEEFTIEREDSDGGRMDGWLNQKVVLKENLNADILGTKILQYAGAIGLCTADLPHDDIFAVRFEDKMWITFENCEKTRRFKLWSSNGQ